MDQSRCPKCKKRLMAMTDKTGRTKLVCLKCGRVDPTKTDAVNGPIAVLLLSPERNTRARCKAEADEARDHATI
jgi:uncharacterized protein YbaR (Trm112 family)